jgi:hypothetical protein
MNLPQYIAKIGDAEFAAKFGVAVRTAAAYRLGERQPRPELAEKIVAQSPVKWTGVYCKPKSAN